MTTSTSTPPVGDRSYGIIPIRYLPSTMTTAPKTSPTSSNTQVLLIHQKTISPSLPYFWTFPKGHAEPGDEDLQSTALRELREETGLVVDREDVLVLRDGGGKEVEFREVYTNPIRRVGKEVKYWVGIVREKQQVKLQAHEVNDARWLSWDEAEKTITFDEGREMLRKARAALDAAEKEISVL